MGRLTNHFDYCDFTECRHYDKELAKKDNCNFIHSSRNQCLEYAVYNKLREYEDLEEQLLKSAEIDIKSMVGEFMHYYNLKKENRLLELPCKVGAELYFVGEHANGKREISSITVNSVMGSLSCKDSIGKGLYLTKAEAEKALAEMGR